MGPTSQKPDDSGSGRPGPDNPAADQTGQRVVGAVSAAVLVAALAVAVVAVVGSGGDSGSTDTEGVFGTHYQGLEDRRVEAGVPTMSDTSAGAHIHPNLGVYVDGEEIPIPVNIGIDPGQPPEMMAGLHTHDSSGVIHVENAAEPTLGQFFDIWGVSFSPDRLGPNEATGDKAVRMWVDGVPSREFGDLVLEDGHEVVVAYGSPDEAPPGVEQ